MDRPCVIIISGILILAIFTWISISLDYFEIDAGGSSNPHSRDFMIHDHDITRDWEAYTLAKSKISEILQK